MAVRTFPTALASPGTTRRPAATARLTGPRRWWRRPPAPDDTAGDAETPDEAYGRVTDPERYRVLHGAGLALLDRLTATYQVEQVEGADVDASLGHDVDAERTVRLVPTADGAAPLTIAFSTFPGCLVRFGQWHVEAYPACGCDACDEDPAGLVERLGDHVDDLVHGQFSESIGTGRKTWLSFGFRTSSGSMVLNKEEPRLPRGVDRHWQPWTRRDPDAQP